MYVPKWSMTLLHRFLCNGPRSLQIVHNDHSNTDSRQQLMCCSTQSKPSSYRFSLTSRPLDYCCEEFPHSPTSYLLCASYVLLCIAAKCSWSFVYCVITCVCFLVYWCILFYCVCFTLVAGCCLEVSIRKVLRPATSAQVFLGFPESISECWDGSQDSKLLLHASHVALQT